MTDNATMSNATTTSTPPRNNFQFDSNPLFCASPVIKEDWPLMILFGVYLNIGLIYTFAGYRFLKFTSYMSGFSMTSYIVYMALTNQPNNLPLYVNLCVSLLVGLIVGLITSLNQTMGLCLNGFHGGVMIVYAMLVIYDQGLEEPIVKSSWPSMMLMAAGGVLMSLLCLYSKKRGTIVSTSIYGGAIVAVCLDFFIEKLDTVYWTWEQAKLNIPVSPPCLFSWLVLCIWPVASSLGLIVQPSTTGRGIHHVPSIAAQKRRLKTHPARLTREQRSVLREKKFRLIYRLRSIRGDVISQSYVQALQQTKLDQWNSASGAGDTLQSNVTHLTALPTEPALPHDSEDEIHQMRLPLND